MGVKGRLKFTNASMIGIGMSQGPLAEIRYVVVAALHCVGAWKLHMGILERLCLSPILCEPCT